MGDLMTILSAPSQTPLIKQMKWNSYNEVDEMVNKRCQFIMDEILLGTKVADACNIMSQLHKLAVISYNNYKGISTQMIEGNGPICKKIHGFIVKGPAHPKHDSTKVPFLIFQLIDKQFQDFVITSMPDRHIFEYSETAIMVVTQSATWPIKMRHDHSIKKIYV